MHLRSALAIGLCLSLVACGTDPEDFGRCTGGLDITVSADVIPEFAWTPTDCPVYEMVVEEASAIFWLLTSQEPVNAISSPIRYGEVLPQGTDSIGDARRLIPGTRYVVRLSRIGDDGLVSPAGELRFLYQPAAAGHVRHSSRLR